MTKQNYETPPEFIAAIERRFGPIDIDLAARADNCKGKSKLHLGLGATRYEGLNWPEGNLEDSLSIDWRLIPDIRVAYLNPPYANIRPWAAQCETVRFMQRWTLMLVPASIGCGWYRDHVHGKANVDGIDRIRFVGTDAVYPKDLMLAAYGFGIAGWGTGLWRWSLPEEKWFI